jgi:hypothetical protein
MNIAPENEIRELTIEETETVVGAGWWQDIGDWYNRNIKSIGWNTIIAGVAIVGGIISSIPRHS